MLVFPSWKETKMSTESRVSAEEAKESLKNIDAAQAASRKRSAAPRWYGISIALLVAVGFSLYAQKDPGDLPGLFLILGTALIVAYFRDKTGVNAKALPDSAPGVWALIAVVGFLLVLFFGGIYLRRSLDMAWIPVVTGLLAGITLYWLSTRE